MSTGEREFVLEEAAVVDRIFRDFEGGISPKEIAKRLNQEGVPGPESLRVESEHDPRSRAAGNGNPEQRAVRRPAGVESPAIRQGPGYGQEAGKAKSRIGMDHHGRTLV